MIPTASIGVATIRIHSMAAQDLDAMATLWPEMNDIAGFSLSHWRNQRDNVGTGCDAFTPAAMFAATLRSWYSPTLFAAELDPIKNRGKENALVMRGLVLDVEHSAISPENQIGWVKRNFRPHICQRRLHHSYEFDHLGREEPEDVSVQLPALQDAPRSADCFSERGKQMRDVWDILTRPGNGHPSPKPVELYTRMLDMTGKAGGTLLEMFGGAGPGAVAAMRWGMRSISIDREQKYLALLAQRVSKERSLPELALAAD